MKKEGKNVTDINIDYEKFAEAILKKMPGSVTGVSLQSFADEYIAFVVRNRAAKTLEGVKLVCKKLLSHFSPIRKIDTIKLKDAEDFLDSLKKNAPKGVYNYHRALRAMFNKAIEWNYLRENPFVKIKLQKIQNQKPTYVTETQLEKIITHIESDDVGDVVVAAFYTGCRLGEIINLTWQNVNLRDDLLTIGSASYLTKSRRQRVVTIHYKVREVLMKRDPSTSLRVTGYVFAKSNGMPFTGDYFSRRFKRACRQADVEDDLHFHCLRHGAATRMILNGAPVPSVQRILGHSNIQTTMIYTHPDLESLREAVNRL